MGDLKIERLRSFDDFVLSKARFQVPTTDSWGRRLKGNLIYYQTNYLLVFAVTFLLMGLLNPQKVLWGMGVTALLCVLVHFLNQRPGATEKIRESHPLLCLLGITGVVYLILGFFFLTSVLLPILIIILHASLRIRNVGNKIANQLDKLGLKSTPMGLFLDVIGLAWEKLDD